jgi:signal transduction histidine kinase
MLGKRCDERGAQLAQLVVGETDRLNKLVDDFLAFARPSPLHRIRDELGRIVRSSADVAAPAAAARSVCLAIDNPAPRRPEQSERGNSSFDISLEPPVLVDPDALRQVFVNLILNAVQASPEGGTVRVAIAWDARTVSARIVDSGPGIPDSALSRVFEPFYSTREGGTGLGLAIAQRIVTEHGGRLALENNPAGGAIATVSLPRGRP